MRELIFRHPSHEASIRLWEKHGKPKHYPLSRRIARITAGATAGALVILGTGNANISPDKINQYSRPEPQAAQLPLEIAIIQSVDLFTK